MRERTVMRGMARLFWRDFNTLAGQALYGRADISTLLRHDWSGVVGRGSVVYTTADTEAPHFLTENPRQPQKPAYDVRLALRSTSLEPVLAGALPLRG